MIQEVQMLCGEETSPAMRRCKKGLLALMAICVIFPQIIIHYTTERKQPKFGVPGKNLWRFDKVHELRKPNSSDDQPQVFDFSKFETNKSFVVNSTNIKASYKNLSKKPRKGPKNIGSLNKPPELQLSLNDELPLINPDWDCTETYTEFQTGSYCLPQSKFEDYFDVTNKKLICLKEGAAGLFRNGTQCHCKVDWHGQSCSMHNIVYNSEYPLSEYAFLVSKQPRRVINALPFTHEFDMLEARLHELNDTVDLFMILESNYTAAGHPRNRLLYSKLITGYLKEYQSKIMYVPLGYYPKKGYHNGWVSDALLRNYMGEGLKRIKNLKENDIFVLNDADELPKRENLLFLKLHYGYPEPIGFNLVHNVYGFFWTGRDKLTHVFGACSIGMLLHFFNWEPYRLRSAPNQMNSNAASLNHYKYKHHGAIHEWSFGHKGKGVPSGWHCSWCFKPQGIKLKLEAAHWSDLPRWGAYPSKTTVEYIRNLTVNGMWFDDRTKLIPVEDTFSDWYAPNFLKQNVQKYEHLLVKPSLKAQQSRKV